MRACGKHLKAHFGNKRVSEIEENEVLMRKYMKKRKEEIKANQMKKGRTEEEVTYTSINRELAFLVRIIKNSSNTFGHSVFTQLIDPS